MEREIREYLLGHRKTFSKFLLDPGNGTAFTKKVWNAASRIPYGRTKTYREVACLAGSPRAQRAVGNALGKNPYPILVPCHRVIASDGRLGGFSSDLRYKKKLLELEGAW